MTKFPMKHKYKQTPNFKRTQITNEPQILKERQNSKQTQITNEP
jgi:hypothetical protein